MSQYSCCCLTTDTHQIIPMQIDSFLIFGVLKISTKVYFLSVHSASTDSSNVCEKDKKPNDHFTASVPPSNKLAALECTSGVTVSMRLLLPFISAHCMM